MTRRLVVDYEPLNVVLQLYDIVVYYACFNIGSHIVISCFIYACMQHALRAKS